MKNINSRSLIYLLGIVIITFSSCTKGYIKSGDKEFANYSYSKAIEKYEKALNNEPDNIDVKLKLAESYRQINKSTTAEKYYREVADSTGLPDESNLHFAQVLMKNNNYDEAGIYLKKYLEIHPNDELANDLLASTKQINELKEDTSAYILNPLPLDNAVSIFGPVKYKDGVVYAAETEITSAASTNPWTGHSYLDMYFNKKDANGYWDIPELFGDGKLNGKFHDGPATFNADQTMIIYTRSAMKNDRKQLVNEMNENNFYLYTSTFKDSVWSDPVELPFNNINYSVGHPSLSKDGKTLYFSSDMPGGYGGSDLYKSTFDGNKWGEPINLGKTINTNGNEVFPFIANDGKLYFSSQGHQTLGGLDVYVSQQNSGIWMKPVNLAYPLNTSQDDFGFILNDNDTTGLVSSNREGVDVIYEFTKVPPIFIIDGLATKQVDGLPLEGVTITLKNLTDQNEITIVTDKDGKFKFNLLPEKEYVLTGEKEDFFKQSETFKTGTRATEKEVNFEFELDEIITSESGSGSGAGEGADANKAYEIGDVFYSFDDATIRPDAEPVLNKLVEQLNNNPNINIEIQAHTDSRGSDSYNQNLSDRRAKSVVNYLTSKGVDKSRLSTKGFGETRLVNNCSDGEKCSEDEHQLNRRTEFIVISK